MMKLVNVRLQDRRYEAAFVDLNLSDLPGRTQKGTYRNYMRPGCYKNLP